MTAFLDIEDVVRYNAKIIGTAGGLRDRGVLEGAVERPRHEFGGVPVHRTVWDKAAALLHGIASTQAFIDGNKRTAWVTAEAFLNLNGEDLGMVPDVQAEAFVLAVAQNLLELERVAEWFRVTAELASQSAMQRTHSPMRLEGGTIKIADLAGAASRIIGLVARNVTLIGPAVVFPTGRTRIESCAWIAPGGDVESLVWDVDSTHRTSIAGAINLHDCDFVDCQFVNIGYASTPEGVQAFLQGFRV